MSGSNNNNIIVKSKHTNRMSSSFLSVIARHALHRKMCRVFRIPLSMGNPKKRSSMVFDKLQKHSIVYQKVL